jgi:Na+-transporting NADH:ubiquinone oxidoreductase subunit D
MADPTHGQPARIDALRKPVLRENPILYQMLGICSALAITDQVSTALAMSGALLFVGSLTALAVSLVRHVTPRRVRIITYMLIIATLVIVVDQFLKARFYEVSKDLGPYVGLIITNCIILGRAEAFASRNRPIPAMLDGAGNAAGYALTLLIIALVREPLGRGTLLGWRMMPADYACQFMAGAPGAFVAMGMLAWIHRRALPIDETAAGGAH